MLTLLRHRRKSFRVVGDSGTVTITDDFNRSDTLLELVATDEGWYWVNGRSSPDTMSVSSNKARVTNSNDYTAYYADYSLGTDAEVQTTVTNEYLSNTSAVSVTARYTDYDNRYHVSRSHNSDDFRLYSRVGGTNTEIGTRYTADPSVPYTMKLVCNGDQISVYIDGVLRIGPVTDTSITTGNYVGIGGYNNGSNRIEVDDFTASSLAADPTFPSTELVAFYKLDESSGNALDSSGNIKTFSETGTVASTTGTIGGETVNVRTLDRPAGKYFSRTDDADFDVADGEDFTISFWAKVSSSMGNYDTGGIFSKRHNVLASDAGYQICLRKVNSSTYVRYNAVCDGTTTLGDSNTDTGIATDAWAHYMMVFTADATLITYVNNAQYSSVDVSSVTGSLETIRDNYIGQLAYNNNGSIIADVTHLGFWKKALDATERTTLYNSGKVLAPSGGGTYATASMTLDATYSNSSSSYSTLNDSTSSSAKVTCNFDKDDTGIIMEHGGTGDGLVLYIYNETLYFQCGDGASAGGDSNTGEVSYTVTDTSSRDFIIEWSADISGCALYVDGTLIGTDVFSNDQLAGGNFGTIGTAAGNAVAANRGSYPSSNTFTGTVTKAEIFLGEVTSDVSGL